MRVRCSAGGNGQNPNLNRLATLVTQSRLLDAQAREFKGLDHPLAADLFVGFVIVAPAVQCLVTVLRARRSDPPSRRSHELCPERALPPQPCGRDGSRRRARPLRAPAPRCWRARSLPVAGISRLRRVIDARVRREDRCKIGPILHIHTTKIPRLDLPDLFDRQKTFRVRHDAASRGGFRSRRFASSDFNSPSRPNGRLRALPFAGGVHCPQGARPRRHAACVCASEPYPPRYIAVERTKISPGALFSQSMASSDGSWTLR